MIRYRQTKRGQYVLNPNVNPRTGFRIIKIIIATIVAARADIWAICFISACSCDEVT